MSEYRYSLTRSAPGVLTCQERGRLCWVMLNPSTADDATDDPTIRRVIRFTRDAGYSELEVVNLFAARTTNPKRLYEHDDPIGPDNDGAIIDAFGRASAVVAAWGASGGQRATERAKAVLERVDQFAHRLLCLGTTADGSPRHPLYVSANTPMQRFRRAPWSVWA